MGTYRIAEVCPNGHVSTSRADERIEQREKFCSRCGEATMTHCPSCRTGIRGEYQVPGIVFLADDYRPPAYCFNCGTAFPWTQHAIENAVQLLEVDGQLSIGEIAQFGADLTELTKDSQKTPIALVRVKKVLGKVGGAVASGVRDIVVDVLSEAVKKGLWG